MLDRVPVRIAPSQRRVSLQKDLGILVETVGAQPAARLAERPQSLVGHAAELALETVREAGPKRVVGHAEALHTGFVGALRPGVGVQNQCPGHAFAHRLFGAARRGSLSRLQLSQVSLNVVA